MLYEGLDSFKSAGIDIFQELDEKIFNKYKEKKEHYQ